MVFIFPIVGKLKKGVNMNLKKDFGIRLKELRKKSGMTQEKFAEEVSIDPKHLSHIETGRSFPKADLIERFAKILQVDPSAFFVIKEQKQREKMIKEIPALVKRLSDRDLEIVYSIISCIVN